MADQGKPPVELTAHARDMLTERHIAEEWVWRTINAPDRERSGEDSNMHYTKAIQETGGRVLHVVINADVEPLRIVTVLFDRRLGSKMERKDETENR